MSLISLICPQCGGNLSVQDDKDFYFCPYCGTKVINQARTTNIYMNNAESADSYFDRWVKAVCNGSEAVNSNVSQYFITTYFDDPRVEFVKRYEYDEDLKASLYYIPNFEIDEEIMELNVKNWLAPYSDEILGRFENYSLISKKIETIKAWENYITRSLSQSEAKNNLLDYCNKKSKQLEEALSAASDYDARCKRLQDQMIISQKHKNKIENIKPHIYTSLSFIVTIILIILFFKSCIG